MRLHEHREFRLLDEPGADETGVALEQPTERAGHAFEQRARQGDEGPDRILAPSEALLWARNGDGFDVIYSTGEFESSVPVSRMRRVREADRAAVRTLTAVQWRDPATDLTEEDIEEASWVELSAACGCRGLGAQGQKHELQMRMLEWLRERNAS